MRYASVVITVEFRESVDAIVDRIALTNQRRAEAVADEVFARALSLDENARRGRLGQSRADYAQAMGQLFAPFTRVAAGNPHSAAPS